jgi:hypothetical protein
MGSFAFARAEVRATGEPSWELYGLASVFALAFAGFVVSRKRTGLPVGRREAGEMLEDARGQDGPYRQMARRVVPRRLPPVSGRLTAFALLMSFVFCALAAPFAMHLPRWVEAEIVFGAGFFAWTGVLATILYRGRRVADDHRFDPSLWFTKAKKKEEKEAPKARKAKPVAASGSSSWLDLPDLGGIGDAGEGCLILIGAILLAGAAVLTAWLLVELVIPALFTVAYLLLIRALKVATNDNTGCAGDLPRSIGRGALYASMFVGPLLMLVLLVHLVARRSGVF